VSSPASQSGWWLALLAFVVVAADQLSKYAVDNLTSAGSFEVIIPGFLNFVHSTNPGVAFGMLADSQAPWRTPLLILFSLAVIGFIVWLLAAGRAGGHFGRYGLALVLGGAAGNLLDRVLRHSVTDFIDVHLGSYHWYTFNLADSAICVGAALILIEISRDWRHASREHA
jgi:signal peptidase II